MTVGTETPLTWDDPSIVWDKPGINWDGSTSGSIWTLVTPAPTVWRKSGDVPNLNFSSAINSFNILIGL